MTYIFGYCFLEAGLPKKKKKTKNSILLALCNNKKFITVISIL